MKVKDTVDSSCCDPTRTRRHTDSGSDGVKYATGCKGVRNQVPCRNYVTGTNTNINLRKKRKIGTWNIRGLVQHSGKLQIVEREMRTYNLDILGLSETHWRNSGHFRTAEGNTVYFSGPENTSSNGVAIIVPPKLNNSVIGYRAVDDRIIHVKIQTTTTIAHFVQIYAPTSTSSEVEIEAFYGRLEEVLTDIPNRDLLFILGDFNAKVGKSSEVERAVGKFGLGQRNERGDRLLEFCIQQNLAITNTLFKHHPRRQFTWRSPDGRTKNQIDYILIKQRWRSSATNCRAYPGADCGTDHQLLVLDFRLRFKIVSRKLIRKTMIPQPSKVQDFRLDIESKLCLDQVESDPEKGWEYLKSIMVETAKKHTPPNNTKRKPWITDHSWDLIQRRKDVKRKADADHAYRKLSREVQRQCRKDKEEYIAGICEEIERHGIRNEPRELFNKIKLLTREFRPQNWSILDAGGNLKTDMDEILETWRIYCADLYKSRQDPPEISWPCSYPREPAILLSEVQEAIRSLKKNKSPGIDTVPGELFQMLGEKGVRIFHSVCTAIWSTGKWPTDWCTSIYVPLHKKGSTTKCENYRTLSLVSHASKVLLKILKTRLKAYLDCQIPQEQAGFVKGKGTREQILNIRQLIEKSREYQVPMIICFVDYQKAFDCVNWAKLWTILVHMGAPVHLVSLIKNLYESNEATVRLSQKFSKRFRTERGVRQGCVLSPDLFNIYGEFVMRRSLDEWSGGITIAGKKITNLRFADDTTLIAATEEEMVELLRRVECESNNVGLKINKIKTKIMIVDRFGTLRLTGLLSQYDLVDSFNYLGSSITSDGNCEAEVRRRIIMAKSAMTRLTKVWRDRSISKSVKVRLVRALVFSVFLYGAETWTLRSSERQKIDAFELWCWRRMLRIPWTAHRTNVSVLSELKIRTRLSSICLQRVLQFFGHIARRDGDNLEKLIVSGNVPGKRARGRSPTRWTDQVQQSTTRPFFQALRDAEDRARWKQLTERIGGNHDHQQ